MVAGFVERRDREFLLNGQSFNAVLEEYGVRIGQSGIKSTDDRAALYRDWLQEVTNSGARGALVWMIGLPKSADQPFDPDPYVIGQGPEADAIRGYARGTAT